MKTILHRALAGSCLAGIMMLPACHRPTPTSEEKYAVADQTPLPPLPASLPMEPGPETNMIPAPPPARLPPAPRPALHRLVDDHDDYAYLDRAVTYDDVIWDAPPDYAFDYDGVIPWGWDTYDGSVAYAEPLAVGYRYYYYEPGYNTPYLIRDPDYSYAFDGSALVAIYDRAGRILPPRDYGPRRDYAGRYFARADALRVAAQSGRRGVVAADWSAQRGEIAAANMAWETSRNRQAAWTAFHDRTHNQQDAHWQAERRARAEAARQFADYQRRGLQNASPAFARYARRDRDRLGFVAPQWPTEQRRMETMPAARQAQDFQLAPAGRDVMARPHEHNQQTDQLRLVRGPPAVPDPRMDTWRQEQTDHVLGERQIQAARQQHNAMRRAKEARGQQAQRGFAEHTQPQAQRRQPMEVQPQQQPAPHGNQEARYPAPNLPGGHEGHGSGQ